MKKKLFIGIGFIIAFIIFTLLVLFVDRKPIGPNNSIVGFALINEWFHNLTGVHFALYNLTDFGSIPAILMGLGFALIGIIEWIKRKSIKKVDKELIILGSFYIIVFIIYALFEFIDINKRPVLIEGVLETSYPSSTTFLSITFMLSSICLFKKYLKNNNIKNVVYCLIYIYMLFLIVFRVISGVHWLTDVIASILIGLGVTFIYYYFIDKYKTILE